MDNLKNDTNQNSSNLVENQETLLNDKSNNIELATNNKVANDSNSIEPSFEELLNQHESQEEEAIRLNPGEKVSVKIVAITNDTIFVSTGSKVDGIVDKEELEINGELNYSVGDTLELYVVTANPYEVRLSKALSGVGSLDVIEQAYSNKVPVVGKVMAVTKGGFAVSVMKRRAFCPLSQIDSSNSENPDDYIGKEFEFLITRFESNGKNIVVSRRSLLDKENFAIVQSMLSSLKVGDVVEATITRFTNFGAFALINSALEGLIHISEISWSHIQQADEILSLGDKVIVVITAIDSSNEQKPKISLSIKQVTGDPWQNVNEILHDGDVVDGKVLRTTNFGAFIEVSPGIEGLAHISEFSYERKIHKAEDVVVAGDIIKVKIKEINKELKKISLSIRDVAGDPFVLMADDLMVGKNYTGTIEKKAPFGLFITIAPGITGLLPNSAISLKDKKNIDKLNIGDNIDVIIKEIDLKSRKISLATELDNSEENYKEWTNKKSKPKEEAFGSLGLALQNAIKNKK